MTLLRCSVFCAALVVFSTTAMTVPEEVTTLENVEIDVQEAAGAMEGRFQDFTR